MTSSLVCRDFDLKRILTKDIPQSSVVYLNGILGLLIILFLIIPSWFAASPNPVPQCIILLV